MKGGKLAGGLTKFLQFRMVLPMSDDRARVIQSILLCMRKFMLMIYFLTKGTVERLLNITCSPSVTERQVQIETMKKYFRWQNFDVRHSQNKNRGPKQELWKGNVHHFFISAVEAREQL